MSALRWELENMALNTAEGSSSEINCCTTARVYSLVLTEILALNSEAGGARIRTGGGGGVTTLGNQDTDGVAHRCCCLLDEDVDLFIAQPD